MVKDDHANCLLYIIILYGQPLVCHLVGFTTKYEGVGGDEGCSARGGHWGLGTLCGDFRKVRGNQRRREE